MKNEKVFWELKERNLLYRIPAHELEELLGIKTDDFDARKRRHGYPDSILYRNFDCEQAGKEKMLTDRLVTSGLEKTFPFWRVVLPEGHFITFWVLLLLSLFGLMGTFISVAYSSLIGVFYGLFAIAGSFSLLWFLKKLRFFGTDPKEYYESSRKKNFSEPTLLHERILKFSPNN